MRTLHFGVLAEHGPTDPHALDQLRDAARPRRILSGGVEFELEWEDETDSFAEWGEPLIGEDAPTGDPIHVTFTWEADDADGVTAPASRTMVDVLRAALGAVIPAGHRLADYVIDSDGSTHSEDQRIVTRWT